MDRNNQEQKKKEIHIEKIYLVLFFTIVGILFLNRLIRGADLTDESFYCTMAFRLVKGNQLLVDMWEQCSTSVVFSSILLGLFSRIGGVEGSILFLRIAFLICNFGATLILFYTQKNYLKKEYVALISLVYLIYAPFHLYTFSYNNLSDMLILLIINIVLLAIEKENIKFFIVAGCFCAFLAFTYPTMIVLCPVMVLLLFGQRKIIKRGWTYFTAGGISLAFIIISILCIKIGFNGILSGIKGILSDPAYNLDSIPIDEKLRKAFEYLFTPISDTGYWIKLFCILLFLVGFLKKKYPVLKLSIALYPIVLYLTIMPASQLGTRGTGTYMFYLSFLCPFLIFFTDKNKELFGKFLYFEWLPSLLFYAVIAVSSYGGALQARQGLFIASIVTLKESVFIIAETFEQIKTMIKERGGLSISAFVESIAKKFEKWTIIIFLSVVVISELSVYYSTVYRDGSVKNLTARIEKGPYKGIYSTEGRKEYLEKMTDLMVQLREEKKTVLVLYHSNFAYLMLDMLPATPTTWGLYPHIDNQSVFLKYFLKNSNHIPETIFVVDVPKDYNFDAQSEKYYEYCNRIRQFIEDNYMLAEYIIVCETGRVKKYVLITGEEILNENLKRLSIYVEYKEGFYGIETNDSNSWTWCSETGDLIIYNDSDEAQLVDISMIVRIGMPKNNNLTINFNNEEFVYEINTERTRIDINTTIQPGENVFIFKTDAEKFVVEGESRDLFFAIYNLDISFQ